MMQLNKLIISMTSYPARIDTVGEVFFSIFSQSVPRNLYHCVLVLCQSEFPNGLVDLPNDLQLLVRTGLIELLWHPTNIKSHKKLMPTIAKYPDDDILVIDDDVYRPEGWLQTFIDDHWQHPNDVITGLIHFYLKNDKFVSFPNYKIGCQDYGNIIPYGRPANGHGGTLYPAHTFSDPRFFDENLFMKLTPTSDESWQFYFNIIEHKPIRLISKAYNLWNFVTGSQNQPTALWRVNMHGIGYDNIWKSIKQGLENVTGG